MGITVVTGGLGFIGAPLCEALAGRGRRVLCVDRLSGVYAPQRGSAAAERLRRDPRIEVAELDVRELRAKDVTAVVHLAALPGVRSRRSRAQLWCENVALTELMTGYAADAGARLVLASSSAVYGNAVLQPTPEHAPTAPLGPYAASKVAAEAACLRGAGAGADVVVARLFTVFGPGQRPDMAIARWTDALLRRGQLDWHPHIGGARELTFIDDAVQGLVAALEQGRAGEIYNIAGSGSHRVDRVLSVLERTTGRRARVRAMRPSPTEATVTAACGAKSAHELGYRPRVSLEDGLRRQVAAAAGGGHGLAA
jgi:UDP-glucuronate 4-epimerase